MIKLLSKFVLLFVMLASAVAVQAVERQKLNFNGNWLLNVGDERNAELPEYQDIKWEHVTLPYAFNGGEAFKKDIVDLTDTIVWYRKHFDVKDTDNKNYFIEFEGVRQAADVYLNGHYIGKSENGVMAFGLELTPYIRKGENVLAVRIDNNWNYRSEKFASRYQWNDRNFNANYGGIPKNVYLHVTGRVYQTLPLYSSLGTTGTYIYATDYDISGKSAVVHIKTQVRNTDSKAHAISLSCSLLDVESNIVDSLNGEKIILAPGEMREISVEKKLNNLHFWSWGYGYLYTVNTCLIDENNTIIDNVKTRTGFRKTNFAEGKIWLNDRVMMIHGYAQRTSNEWPGVGLSVPAWLSDFSNDLMVKSNGNLVRWMHVTPWKQDIESCDRVGLLQAMPAGDAEKDVEGARWKQRTELMRDAIIYNRNNPSIIFYECGNESISKEHMQEMKSIRDQYDAFGGRAMGSREMLDIDEAEYGGEMLYINKSKKHPMWAMEYCRDEGLRKYWDEYSYPYHKEGEGPLYRGNIAREYNHNMDELAKEMVRRWYEYWQERPGQGKRVNSGGVKIIFSDTNTHHRGEANYRSSGVTDAMRIPKDAFFAHQVMWDGWVNPEKEHTYIIGHWNYNKDCLKSVNVVSTGKHVVLYINGKKIGEGKCNYRYLFTFDSIRYEPGVIEAVSYDDHYRELSKYSIRTAGKPYQLKLTSIMNPEGMKSDGADMVLVQVEAVDKQGNRCPLDHRMIHFNMYGEGQWIGGIGNRSDKVYVNETKIEGQLDSSDKKNISNNYVGEMSLPLECGINRILIRSTTHPGTIHLGAYADGITAAYLSIETKPVDKEKQLSSLSLPVRLDRGPTPLTASYVDEKRTIKIVDVQTGSSKGDAINSYDDNELSEWHSDGKKDNAWITYHFSEKARVDEVVLKMAGWRQNCYPLALYAGNKKIWQGYTYASLGYVHINIDKPVLTNNLTIKMLGPVKKSSTFGDTKELAGGNAGTLDRTHTEHSKVELRIVEVDILEKLNK